MSFILYVTIKKVRISLQLTKPQNNLIRLDYEAEINQLQNSLTVRALIEIKLSIFANEQNKVVFLDKIWNVINKVNGKQ